MRYAILTSEPGDVARGSGTAVAIWRLRNALQAQGVHAPVFRPRSVWPSSTIARRRFNTSLRAQPFLDYDAVLGVNGDGWIMAQRDRILYVALVKAMYAGALEHEHGMTRALLRLHSRWEALGARAAARVIVPSRFAAEAVRSRYGVDEARIHVVPEPFDTDAWRASLPAVERAGNRVLCVAHLYPRKRVADVIRAWPLVHATRPDARLDVAGAGPELRRLAHLARGLPACYLHGHVAPSDVLQLYARADAFCLPSAQETFGYAAVEAMASGLPLVIADAGALPEVCAGAVAEHVPVGDVTALATAIVRSLDGNVRARAATANPARAQVFTPDVVARRFVEAVSGRVPRQRRAGGRVSRRTGSRR